MRSDGKPCSRAPDPDIFAEDTVCLVRRLECVAAVLGDLRLVVEGDERDRLQERVEVNRCRAGERL